MLTLLEPRASAQPRGTLAQKKHSPPCARADGHAEKSVQECPKSSLCARARACLCVCACVTGYAGVMEYVPSESPIAALKAWQLSGATVRVVTRHAYGKIYSTGLRLHDTRRLTTLWFSTSLPSPWRQTCVCVCAGVRGVAEGTLVAYDMYTNLLLRDVTEKYSVLIKVWDTQTWVSCISSTM